MSERVFQVYSTDHLPIRDNDTVGAVIAKHGPLLLQFSINTARELALDLANAADQAELKLDEK